MGRTWSDIAQVSGFASAGAASTAVVGHIERMPAEDQATARAFSAGNYRLVIAKLYEVVARAHTAGKPHTAVQALQVIAEVQDRHDRLTGLHVMVPTQVHVSVQSMTEVLADTRSRLQAAIDAAPPDVLDVETVELQEIER